MKSQNKSPPCDSAPVDWVSGNKLRNEGYRGGADAIDIKLRRLRDRLIRDISERGIAMQDAVILVDHNLIGMKKPPKGRSALYASPDAVRILDQEERETRVPVGNDGWLTGQKLLRTHFLGKSDFNSRLNEFREGLTRDLVDTGYSETDAAAIVDHNLIGGRRTIRSGKLALHVSPSAVEMLEREGWIRKKLPGGKVVRSERDELIRRGLIDDITAAGVPKSEAIAIVERNFASWPEDAPIRAR